MIWLMLVVLALAAVGLVYGAVHSIKNDGVEE